MCGRYVMWEQSRSTRTTLRPEGGADTAVGGAFLCAQQAIKWEARARPGPGDGSRIVATPARTFLDGMEFQCGVASETYSRRCWRPPGTGDRYQFQLRNAVALFQIAEVLVHGSIKGAGSLRLLPSRAASASGPPASDRARCIAGATPSLIRRRTSALIGYRARWKDLRASPGLKRGGSRFSKLGELENQHKSSVSGRPCGPRPGPFSGHARRRCVP
jgi:hypothetical protein